MNSRRQDPVKSAIYNPKEFRRGHVANRLDVAPVLSRRKCALVLLAAAVGLSILLWRTTGSWTSPATAAPPPTGPFGAQRHEPPGSALAPLKLVGTRDGQHCMLHLADWRSKAPVMAVFVRNGETAETLIPAGQYRGTIACGSAWYGDQQFGPRVVMDEIETPLVFLRSESGQIKGLQIELSRRIGGNLRTRPVLRY